MTSSLASPPAAAALSPRNLEFISLSEVTSSSSIPNSKHSSSNSSSVYVLPSAAKSRSRFRFTVGWRRERLGRRRSRAEPKSGERRASVSARAKPRVRRRRAHARIRQPVHVSSADCVSRLDRAPISPDPRFGRADAVADRKRATDGGRCDRRTPPRASRGVSAGSGRRGASPRRETYHDKCAATMSRSRRTARVSCAAHVCDGATHHARLE